MKCSYTTSVLFCLLLACQDVLGQQLGSCEGGSCYPATGDLLVGREHNLTASSTCGLEDEENFCIVSHLQDIKKCFVCDSRDPNNEVEGHRVENIVSSFNPRRNTLWWQAENGKEEVYIQLNLEAVFHFTHLIMTFKTFRPAAMIIERSSDFGSTWQIYRYFAYNCEDSFPGIRPGPPVVVDDIVCESRYSGVEPSTEGEVIVKVLDPHIAIDDPYSLQVQDLLSITNLRINFTKLHTLGDNLLDNRPEIREKYYYAIYDMVVRGSCHCYGHAERCVPLDGMAPFAGMVYGQCDCTHFTMGRNCELCRPFYNDQPWRPARENQPNQCKRCNCNEHATRCHYDPAVFQATGQISGGVCDGCMHNTMGRNCEQCKPYYYMNPNLDIRDPNLCVPCSCDPNGGINGGECVSHSDPDYGMTAGDCLCKRFVGPGRCDTCLDGYWNLRADNPEGCEECACNILGTIGNSGCNKYTGECSCKRLVTGRTCDQCLDGFWGLGPDEDGCKPCDCDPGGAYNNFCDKYNGQCVCRPNIIGRRCDTPNSGYFTPYMDYLVYEAELAQGVGQTSIEERPRPEGRIVTWTGTGFRKVLEGGSVIFEVYNIPYSGEYNIMLRYEPQMMEPWEEARITITRPGEIPTSSICGNTIPQDDLLLTTLLPGQRYQVLSQSVCLEQGVYYTIRVDFNRYQNGGPTPNAQILFDSMVLIPQETNLDLFTGPVGEAMLDEFERYRCRESQISVIDTQMPELCDKYTFSLSAILYDGALPCECDPTGSQSSICQQYGGQCQCKPNVIGRRCDQCAPATYGFSPVGCLLCSCNDIGSSEPYCDEVTGQCPCNPNVFGRQCDLCQDGFWNFPTCEACTCNGMTTQCDSRTGTCLGCTGFTTGTFCQLCEAGYYGDPRTGRCQPCMCPGGADSGYQYADTCTYDARTSSVICNCKPGYTGYRCEQCDNNYFGNPLQPGGSCDRCDCSNNVDETAPGNCDADTGECLRCLYNTQGPHCEQCMPGYYGDALLLDGCVACVCNILGTNRSDCDPMGNCGICDSVSGQCPCLPNVLGRRCDQCAPNHWKLASGQGCDPCNCCMYGSNYEQCNLLSGQCSCKPGFGGKGCCNCEDFHWGDPLSNQCQPCDCDPTGSETMQCHADTGQCVCREGVTGYRCDQCARGTSGDLPCEPCGECFDNWDEVIAQLRNQTLEEIERVKNLKTTGATGAYDDDFKELEDKLDEVEKILNNPNVTLAQVRQLETDLDNIRKALDDYTKLQDQVEVDITQLAADNFDMKEELKLLQLRADRLKQRADDLEKNVSAIALKDTSTAYSTIKDARDMAEDAKERVEEMQAVLDESKRIRTEANNLMDAKLDDFNEQFEQYRDEMGELENQIDDLENQLASINEEVCGEPGDTCGSCGGAGCGECGGIGCGGALPLAEQAMNRANTAKEALASKEAKAGEMLDEMGEAKEAANQAQDAAQMAYNASLQAKEEAEGAFDNITGLLNQISEFLAPNRATPNDVELIAQEVLAMGISLTPEQILDLARQINETIETNKNLTDIDDIKDATKEDLDKARQLKDKADAAKAYADEVLVAAEGVVKALEDAEAAQDEAQTAISDAEMDIAEAEASLEQIKEKTEDAINLAQAAKEKVGDMEKQQSDVQNKFTDNRFKIEEALGIVKIAEENANNASMKADELVKDFMNASAEVEARLNVTENTKDAAEKLKNDAANLELNTRQKKQELEELQDTYNQQQGQMQDIADELNKLNDEMTMLLSDIQEKAKYYSTCKV